MLPQASLLEEVNAEFQTLLTNEKLISEIKENLKTIEKEFDNQKIFDKVEKIILNLAKTKK